MARLRVLDLFSGIGGFSLGLEATGGFEVVAHCEIEPFCQEILHRYWPQVKLYKDIKELNYGQLETDGLISKQGDIDLICGGYPCQPFSVAGRKGGEADPRHLWPEYFRLIRELRPRYAVGENVGGHIRLGLDSVLEDLDSEDYTARCFSVEAACIGAPHRRERIFWIAENMAHTESFERGSRQKSGQSKRNASGKCTGNGSSHVADPESNRNQRIPGELPPAQRGSQSQEKGSEFIGGSSHVADSHSGCSDRTHKEVRARGKTPDDGSARAREAETMAHTESIESREPTQRERREDTQRGSNDSRGLEGERAENGSGAVPDTDPTRLEGRTYSGDAETEGTYAQQLTAGSGQRNDGTLGPVESWVGDGTYGISAWLDGSWEHGLERVGVNIPQRKAQLMALGNAVVPQLVALVGHAILENHDTIVSETEVENERV